MILRLHPVTPEKRYVQQIAEKLDRGAIYILPTDSVYALCCSLTSPKSINELYKIKNISEKQHLSLLCRDVSMASRYLAHGLPGPIFRFMKSVTPGPYTFILNANRTVDRRGTGKRKTVGIRIVDHPLHIALMEQLEEPLIATSLTDDEEFLTEAEDLDRLYGSRVEAVVDGGSLVHEYSTVIDCTTGALQLLRRGRGEVEGVEYEDLTDQGDQ